MINAKIYNWHEISKVLDINYNRLAAHFRIGRKLTKKEATKLEKFFHKEGINCVNVDAMDFLK